jgi:prepilin-type N-terminal cleavage/methylation domain-containing protein
MVKHIRPRRLSFFRGFTLVELMACTAILLIAALAASPALVGAQRGSQRTRSSVAPALVQEGREARLVLQRVVRRASRQSLTLGPDGQWIDLPCYESPDSAQVDRYARLSWANGGLDLQEGQIDGQGSRQILSDTVLSENVAACVFTVSGTAVRMKLTFSQTGTQMTVAAAAITNNP